MGMSLTDFLLNGFINGTTVDFNSMSRITMSEHIFDVWIFHICLVTKVTGEKRMSHCNVYCDIQK